MNALGVRLLVTCPPFQLTLEQYRSEFERRNVTVLAPPVLQQFSEDELIGYMSDVDGVIAGDDPFTERVIASAPRLRALVKWGVGVDSIDQNALRKRDIYFSNTPGVFGDEVADVAMGYVIVLLRQLQFIHDGIIAGNWPKPAGRTLRGLTIGVVGLGTIGKAVIKRAVAFGMHPVAYDVLPAPADWLERTGTEQAPLDDVLTRADIVVVCCSLTPESKRLLSADRLSTMKLGSFIVNVSRGAVIEESALVDRLRSGHIAGAALDVFESEPLPAGNPLRAFKTCIFGSHNSSNTVDAVARVNRLAIDLLLAALKVPEAGI